MSQHQPAPRSVNVHPASNSSLRVELRTGDRRLYAATGFVVQSRVGHLLMLSRQVVTGRRTDDGALLDPRGLDTPDRIVIWHHIAHRPGQWRAVAQVLLHRTNGSPLWIEHPVLGAKADFVALRLLERALGSLDPLILHPYSISPSSLDMQFAPADRVSIVGFPLDLRAAGFSPVWSAGHIASEPGLDFDNLPVVLLDARTTVGQWGAPVIATDGDSPRLRLLGMYGGTIDEKLDIGRVWKTSALLELIDSVGPYYGDAVLNGAVSQQRAWLDFAADFEASSF